MATAARLVRTLGTAGEWEEVARLAFVGCATESQLSALSPEEVEAAVREVRSSIPPGMMDHFDLASRVDVRADLAQVRVPTLVAVPTGDRMVLPEGSRRLAAGIPSATLVELPGAGHILDADSRSTWLGHVREFLAAAVTRPA